MNSAPIFPILAAVMLAGCTADISGYSLELARAKCAEHGGIGFVRALSATRDYSNAYCINGTVITVYRGKVE